MSFIRNVLSEMMCWFLCACFVALAALFIADQNSYPRTVDLPENTRVIDMGVSNGNIWYVTRSRHKNLPPTTYTVTQRSMFGTEYKTLIKEH